MRTPTRLLTLLAAIGLSAAGLIWNASSALAGAGSWPPTDGFATYGPSTATLACSTGTAPQPTSLSFQLDWDARAVSGSYRASATLMVFNPQASGISGTVGNPVTVPFPITVGTSGTFSYDFTLPANTQGDEYYISVDPVTNDGRTYSSYVENSGALDCATPGPDRVVPPSATISPIACDGSHTLTLNNSQSTDTWGITLLFKPSNSFDPEAGDVRPGQTTTIHEPGNLNPGGYVVVDPGREDSHYFASFPVAVFSLAKPASCDHHPTVSLNTSSVAQGGHATVTGSGFVAGEHVTAVLHSTPLTLGTYTATNSGAVTFTFTVPSTFTPGTHTITLTGASGLTASVTFTVTPSAATTGSSPTPTTKTTSTATASGPIANTGIPTATFGALATGLILAGGLALAYGSRRRRKPRHSMP